MTRSSTIPPAKHWLRQAWGRGAPFLLICAAHLGALYRLTTTLSRSPVLTTPPAVVGMLMSIASWFIIVTRAWRVVKLRRAARASADFWHAHSYGRRSAYARWRCGAQPVRHLAEEGKAAIDHHASNKSVLASVGTTAPFVGLFGTVWGIYHALVGIGVAGQASIDKVAGPVGEALIMTAFGLAVAIPAVLGYNALMGANKGMLGKLNRFARRLHAYFLTGAPVARVNGKASGNGDGQAMPVRAAAQV